MENDSLTWDADADPPHYYNSSSNWRVAALARSHLESGNVETHAFNTSQGWAAATFLQSIEPVSIAVLGSHGTPTGAWSDTNDYWYYYDFEPPYDHPSYLRQFITGTVDNVGAGKWAILPHRVDSNGSGLPPFNTGAPPISLAYVLACVSGMDNDFAEGFLFPYTNWYVAGLQNPIPPGQGPMIENQAFVGYRVAVKLHKYEQLADYSFHLFKEGYSVRRAMDKVFSDVYVGTSGCPATPEEFVAVFGDHATRIHGVYTRSNDTNPVNSWFCDEPPVPSGM
jgi:hypothetical protein